MADEHGPDAPDTGEWRVRPHDTRHLRVTSRKYLPTAAELIDRLCIVQLKAIFIPGHHQEYLDEASLIKHDIAVALDEKHPVRIKLALGELIGAATMLMLTNRFIWENESKARAGGSDQDKLLKLTHSINGVRSIAKNEIAKVLGDRVDRKVDCFAAELEKEFGNWNVFDAAPGDK